MDKNNKKIEVVTGNGENLDISEVSTHISSVRPKNKDDKKQEIVIPQVKNKNNDNKKN